MKVYVVTNPDLGWDSVVAVCLDKGYAKDKYPKYIITPKLVNETKFVKKHLEFKPFDDATMYCFLDGALNYGDGFSQKELATFKELVERFGNDHVEVVYHEEYKYHFIAYLGLNESNFKWTTEMEALSDSLGTYLEDNNVKFWLMVEDEAFLDAFRTMKGVYDTVDPEFHKYVDKALLATRQYITQPKLDGAFDYSWLPAFSLRVIRLIANPNDWSVVKLKSEDAITVLDNLDFDAMMEVAIIDLTKLAEDINPVWSYASMDIEAELNAIYSDNVVIELTKEYT